MDTFVFGLDQFVLGNIVEYCLRGEPGKIGCWKECRRSLELFVATVPSSLVYIGANH